MPNVAIYTTSTCVYCKKAKDYFANHNIGYTEYNVGTDVEKRKEMIEMTGQLGVPVITVGEKVMVGFDESTFEQMLKD